MQTNCNHLQNLKCWQQSKICRVLLTEMRPANVAICSLTKFSPCSLTRKIMIQIKKQDAVFCISAFVLHVLHASLKNVLTHMRLVPAQEFCIPWNTPGRRQLKTPILLRNVDQKSLETEFSIAICRHTGDKWQSKTLFLSIFDPRSSIVDSVSDFRLPGVWICTW